MKGILWKYDSELGIAYFCPHCRTFVCTREKCRTCGQESDWHNKVRYKGRVKWN